LGAGLDARAHRLPGLGDVTVFEVDHPSTQSFKRRGAASLPLLSRELHYVATNFEGDDLTVALKAAGHDASTPSVFIWEGVVMYLSGAAVDATLGVLRERAAAGSTLAVTYVEPVSAWGGLDGRALRHLLGSIREPVRTDWTPADARRHLALHGFDVTSDESDPEWCARFTATRTEWSFERLAIAVRR
jgi:methyltransferase (TIGR00027 family)